MHKHASPSVFIRNSVPATLCSPSLPPSFHLPICPTHAFISFCFHWYFPLLGRPPTSVSLLWRSRGGRQEGKKQGFDSRPAKGKREIGIGTRGLTTLQGAGDWEGLAEVKGFGNDQSETRESGWKWTGKGLGRKWVGKGVGLDWDSEKGQVHREGGLENGLGVMLEKDVRKKPGRGLCRDRNWIRGLEET